jgi:hypothetical protein
VPPDPISPGVRRFVAEHIDSVTQLELLLILHRDPARAWSAEGVGREMRLPPAWAGAQLERFTLQGLLVCSEEPQASFSYRADSPWVALVDEVADVPAAPHVHDRLDLLAVDKRDLAARGGLPHSP